MFFYIKNEDDILVVTKNLVKNLKEDPTAKSTADPIWEEGMTALLEALIGYVFYELEPEERNMNSVMTLLLMLESQGDGPNSVSQLDLLFDDLSINKPNSFAAKQYKLYKMAPGKTAQSINGMVNAVRMNLPAYMGVRYELTNQIEDAEELLDNLHNYNQKIFKVCILIHTYGRNNAELDERVQQICNTVQQQTCRFSPIPFEQCAAMNSVLPLGKKWLALERTLLTVNTAIYVPFTTQELFQPGGLYEGTNARSKNLIMVNRKLLPAPAGMVLGMTGFGKSFAVMQMMAGIMLRWPEDDLVIIDPENEYARLVEAFGGEVIEISASSKSHINPMDISEDYGDEGNPIQLKSQFLRDFCQLVLNSKELSAQECSLVDRAALITYQKYLLHPEREQMPSLHDFYNNLSLQGPQAKALTMALSMYVDGTMDLFAHQTNVDLQNHCICFNTVKLGKSMQSIGMMTVLDQIWNRITRNRVLGRRTWIFTDEFQLLLGNSACTNYYFELSSRARKWGAILTSITQHVRSVLNNEDARRMLSDCGYIKLLNQAPDDANDIARLLHISDEEKRYIENAEVGSGLLIADKVVVPFNNTFPQDTELFRLMDTNPNSSKQKAPIKSL